MSARVRTRERRRERLVLAAHGTSDPEGQAVLAALRDLVALRLPQTQVRLSFVDVIGPHLADVLRRVPDAIVVPLFLSTGYHVRTDVPRAVEQTGGRAVVTAPVGPSSRLLRAVAHRFDAAGPAPEATVLAAAGSRDPGAIAQVHEAAGGLSDLLGRPVEVGFAASGAPTVSDTVAALRAGGAREVGVASYLLAPGVFQRRLEASGADLVAAPIGTHPLLVDLVVERFEAAAAAVVGREVA